MNNLEKLPIFFINIETLINMYQENEKIEFENLGVIVGSKFILSQVLYLKKKIIKIPYSIFVDKKTYTKKRELIIKYMIEELIIKKYHLGQKKATIYTSLGHVISFIDWIIDDKTDFLNSIEEAQKVFLEYTYYLNISIKNNIYTQGSAHSYQYAALKMLQYFHDDKENKISTITPLIKNIRDTKMEKSLDKDKKYHFNFYYKFFHGIANFILNYEKYPFKLNLVSNDIWVTPSPFGYIMNNHKKKVPKCFNIISGEPYTIEEMKTLYNIQHSTANNLLKYYQTNLDKHNTNYRSYYRISLANSGLKAYYILFLSITGMNDSTASTILWDDKFEITKGNQKFHNIKCRAGNKIVEFQIQSKFIKDFKKYLELRKYLLNGQVSSYLFFTSSRNINQISFRNKTGSFSSFINREMKKNIDPVLPMLHSRQLRINKISQVIKNDGIIVASQIAQSSINTLIKFYQGESFESTSIQLTQYFQHLNKHIFEINQKYIETSIGYCNNYNSPYSEIMFANKPINCKQPESCLFCESYALHGDKSDFKKIYSLQYVILESKFIAKDIQHFEDIYTPVLKRIETICNEAISLKKISLDELNQIKNNVFITQNLDPYWEHKLNSLVLMGILK